MSRLFTIWRPHVPESIDGLPLVTKVSEFFTNFPYHRLPDRPILAFCLRPEIAFGLVVFYLLSDKPVAMFRDAIRLDPKSNSFRNCIAVHNLLLGIFSAVCAWNSYPVVVSHLMKYGAFDTYCDPNGTLWHEGLGAWSTIFYLSKYYEFLDTWVLVLKGKQASFLQVYHHAGIVLTMYGGVVSQSAWLQVVVLLNSVIHTFMYTYFLIKTLAPKVEIKSAKYLTMAQIGQFIIGISSTLGVLIMGEKCDTASSRFSLACLDMYGLGLIALFVKRLPIGNTKRAKPSRGVGSGAMVALKISQRGAATLRNAFVVSSGKITCKLQAYMAL